MSRLERNHRNLELADMRLASKEVQKQWLETVEFKNPEEQKIFDVILALQLNPTSIDTNIFPLLKLSKDLKIGIREAGLEGSKARELNKLSAIQLNINEVQASKVRIKLTEKVIKEKLSLSQTKALVKETLTQHKSSQPSPNPNRKLIKTVKTIRSIELTGIYNNELEEIRQALQGKIEEIDKIIAKSDSMGADSIG